jgi:hypothetical protein
MAYRFNGIGTIYYGHRDKLQDSSYIATKWFVILYLPVVPLGSFRIWEEKATDPPLVIFNVISQERSMMVRPVPLNRTQVFLTYLAFYGSIAFVSSSILFCERFLGW